MKVFSVVAKIVIALAAVAGAVYIAATYGDKIVAWCKRMLGCEPFNPCFEMETEPEEAPVQDLPVEDAPAEGVADESDFEG